MILYHMSQTLKLGDEIKPDYQKNMRLVQPLFKPWSRTRISSMEWY